MQKLTRLAYSALLAIALPLAGCSTPPVDTEQMLTDNDVTNKAKSAIYSDPMTRDSMIDVRTLRGIVTLKGSVNSQSAMDRAVELARKASGAMGVKNELVLR